MTHSNNQSNRVSLPPIPDLLPEFFACQRGCQQLFRSRIDAFQHGQACTFASRNIPFADSQHRRFPAQPYPFQNSFSSRASSVNSDETDSAGSSTIYSPSASRAQSVSAPSGRRDSAGVIRTEKKPKSGKKSEKEKHSRDDQGAVHRREEDCLRNYGGWRKVEQSGGNGNAAGIEANKIKVMRGFEAAGMWAIHREYCRALEEDRADEFQEEFRAIVDSATASDPSHHQAYFGTFMCDEREIPCAHADAKSKACIAHVHPDWRECRRTRIDAIFHKNHARYLRKLQAMQQATGRPGPRM